MITDTLKTLLRRLKRGLRRHSGSFLDDVSGVVHVGANLGQEREIYDAHGLNVVWIEPIPEVFARLNANLRGFENQRAIQALVTDVDDKEYDLHIASNHGQSSSIFQLKRHKDIWPHVHYTTTVALRSTTLATLLKRERVDATRYQALVIDTQGSELLVLRGSIPRLRGFDYIKVEVADFESYEGCCRLSDIEAFMTAHGFKEHSRKRFASVAEVGSYFDIVYTKHR